MDRLRYFVFGFTWGSRERQTASPSITCYELLPNHCARPVNLTSPRVENRWDTENPRWTYNCHHQVTTNTQGDGIGVMAEKSVRTRQSRGTGTPDGFVPFAVVTEERGRGPRDGHRDTPRCARVREQQQGLDGTGGSCLCTHWLPASPWPGEPKRICRGNAAEPGMTLHLREMFRKNRPEAATWNKTISVRLSEIYFTSNPK